MSYETWVSGSGQKLLVHTKEQCVGNTCPVHNPSVAAESIGITHYREDRGIIERLCSHGVGHPDPDDIRVRQGGWAEGVHGCDGCCQERKNG